MELKDKVALITGATGGIGEAVARNLNEAGVKILLTGRSEEKLKKLAAELGDADFLAGEITDAALPEKLIAQAIAKFKRLDIVFSNAGVMNVGAIDEVDIEKICEMVKINVESVFRLGYTVLRHFKKQGNGYLIHTSSISGIKTDPTLGAYCGTKFAVEAFTDALRMELAGTNIGVACVEPGPVETGLFKDWNDGQKQFIDAEGKLDPADIARGVRFILEQPDGVRVPRMLIVPSTMSAN